MKYRKHFFPATKIINEDYDVNIFELKIIPCRAYDGLDVYRISNIPYYYIINRIRICTIHNKIMIVYLDTIHPNANPISLKYCLPEIMIESYLNESSLYLLKNFIERYNLHSCYFTPKDIEFVEKIGKGGFHASFS